MRQCAIYTRVSTSMQAEKDYNSCEAQRDKILSYIKSQENLQLYKEYSDPAFSGSNIDRPELKELLRDIAAKKIQMVLTYKIDRLTRSSKDFYSLIDFFEKHGVSFVSVSEHFDTSSASGRLLRNVMLTFAQFEREMSAKRTRDKMMARVEKGLWNGGIRILGYKSERGKLLLVSKEVTVVREIFEKFALTGSIKETMDYLKEKEIKNPKTDSFFPISTVFNILRNPTYIGKTRWAKKVFQGSHPPIISNELFEHVQSLTKEKIIKRPLHKEYLLKGLLKCQECGSNMTPAFTNKKIKRYYYYKCYSVIRNGCSACTLKQINSEKLENFLIENLSRLAQDKQYIETLAFKITHESLPSEGFELLKRSSETLATKVSQVLINFKNSVQNNSPVEKILLLRKTIKQINISMECLEVILFIEDTSIESLYGENDIEFAKVTARMCGEHPNPCAPHCTSHFATKQWRGRRDSNPRSPP